MLSILSPAFKPELNAGDSLFTSTIIKSDLISSDINNYVKKNMTKGNNKFISTPETSTTNL